MSYNGLFEECLNAAGRMFNCIGLELLTVLFVKDFVKGKQNACTCFKTCISRNPGYW